MQLTAALFILTVLISACSATEQRYIGPETESCEEEAIDNEFIIVKKGGLFVRSSRSPSLREIERDEVMWYEPNYRVHVERRLNRLIQVRNGEAYLTEVASNEQTWEQLGIENFWNENFFGQDVPVAVLDTGVQSTSNYLEDRWVYNKLEYEAGEAGAGVDDDGNGLVDDISGWNFIDSSPESFDEWNHGTQIAHIIAGSAETPSGPGVAPKARILPIDFMNESGGDEIDAVKAIDYAISRGAKIINNSWVTPCSRLLKVTLENHSQKNVLFVNAAGNQGKELSAKLSYSSNIPGINLISVGSLDRVGQRSIFSNYGQHIRFFAPGEGILTFYGLQVSESSGTSFSAAIVSGAAALLWSKYPDADVSKIKKELLLLAEPPGAQQDYYSLKLK